jgi:hypothetical protein
MTDLERLESFFEGREWYDNSFLRLADNCFRKGFYARIGPTGVALDQKVGPGANFGTCFHGALAAYSTGWGRLTEPQRRVMGVREFSRLYAELGPWENKNGKIPTNHTFTRGLNILDAYFDFYLDEDNLFKPIESELGFAVEFSPRLSDPSDLRNWEPFTYVGGVDGIFERSYDRRHIPRETKTTSSGAEGRLRQLNFDHQPVGYVTCLRELPGGENIDTFIGDVVLIAAEKLEFCRDYFTTSAAQRQSWRVQTIRRIERWRDAKRKATGQPINVVLDIYTQNTDDCFSYGKCAFYDLCDYGVSPEALATFDENKWNPLLHRPPSKIELSAEGQIDTITIAR